MPAQCCGIEVLLASDLVWDAGRAYVVAGELVVEVQGAGAIGTAIAEAVAAPPRLVDDGSAIAPGGYRLRA